MFAMWKQSMKKTYLVQPNYPFILTHALVIHEKQIISLRIPIAKRWVMLLCNSFMEAFKIYNCLDDIGGIVYKGKCISKFIT